MSELLVQPQASIPFGLSYLYWDDVYHNTTGSIFQTHADDTPFSGETTYFTQKVTQATKENKDSEYYTSFNKMQKTIGLDSISARGSAGNVIYFVSVKENNTKIVSYFRYGLDNKLIESQSFRYSGDRFTGRTKSTYNPLGQKKEIERFNHRDKLIKSESFSYKAHGSVIDEKIYYSDGNIKSRNRSHYDFVGRVTKSDKCNPDGSLIERTVFEYKRGQSPYEKLIFNSKLDLISKEEFGYNKNGELCRSGKINYNGKNEKDIETHYYSDGKVSTIINDKYSLGGNIRQRIEKEYDIANSKLIKKTELNYSMDGILKKSTEQYIHANGKGSKRITQYYKDGVNLTRKIELNFATTGKITGKIVEVFDSTGEITKKVVDEFDTNGNMTRTIEENDEISYEIKYRPIDKNTMGNSLSDTRQLADSISSFPTQEKAPAPEETIISATLGKRSLVPVMSYVSPHSGCPLC
ncbi:rhs family protein [Yersinia aldovae]|uniref:hypothetical protein n=1 Tax=Yersinia aldovae TaxID=29483 RepID=UPI0005E3FABA|nr:hypothetical protein [Yersinia aldovae]CNI17769.1 rhs family protein [Yersinia aldovae]